MITSHHKKIAIIGNAGSGKTTLAFKLHEKLKLPLYHLDQYYWLPNWQRIGLERFSEIHNELCRQDTWIMEGPYIKVLSERVKHADVIIFLDMPRYLCIWRVLKRSVFHYGQVIPGNPPGCEQNLFSFKFFSFLKWVFTFNKQYRTMILDILHDKEFTGKQIYILQNSENTINFINQIENTL